MRARSVDPRDQQWEVDDPAYRVYFWRQTGTAEALGWESEEWELSESDVDSVLAWADAHAEGRSMTIWVVHRESGRLGLMRLAGIEPTAPSETWPSWATARGN